MVGSINRPVRWQSIIAAGCIALALAGPGTAWAAGRGSAHFPHPHALPPHSVVHLVLVVNGARNDVWFKPGDGITPDSESVMSYGTNGRPVGYGPAVIIGTQGFIPTGPNSGVRFTAPASSAASVVDGSWVARQRARGVAITVQTDEILPEAAAPTGIFTVSAHLTPLDRDPDGSPTGTVSLSVAQALAYPDRPALVLAGDPSGLRLWQVTHVSTPDTAAVQYQYTTSPQLSQLFTVMLVKSGSGTVQAASPFIMGPFADQLHPDTFTINGASVNGYSAHLTTRNPDGSSTETFVRFYTANNIGVKLASIGLTASAYAAAVGALVDGRQHADVVAQLQRELSAAPSPER